MKQTLNEHVVEAFCTVCHSYQLDPQFVLQTIADSVSVHGFLDPNADRITYLAAKIFSCFFRDYRPVHGLSAVKRNLAIQNIQRILEILNSHTTNEKKQTILQELEESWFKENGILGEGTELFLNRKLSIMLSKGLLLQCDTISCQPQDLLYFFMRLVVTERTGGKTNGPALKFLTFCAEEVNARYN